jgi:hypothetical protein
LDTGNPIPQSEILRQLQPLLEKAGRRYRKCRNIFAKRATDGEKIDTVTADGKETSNTARAGDYIIRNQTGAGEQYLLNAEKFAGKYVHAGPGDQQDWEEYRPVGEILAVELTADVLTTLGWPGEFYFMARWGEPMVAKTGDFLAVPPDRSEVYRIARKEFFETYAPV